MLRRRAGGGAARLYPPAAPPQRRRLSAAPWEAAPGPALPRPEGSPRRPAHRRAGRRPHASKSRGRATGAGRDPGGPSGHLPGSAPPRDSVRGRRLGARGAHSRPAPSSGRLPAESVPAQENRRALRPRPSARQGKGEGAAGHAAVRCLAAARVGAARSAIKQSGTLWAARRRRPPEGSSASVRRTRARRKNSEETCLLDERRPPRCCTPQGADLGVKPALSAGAHPQFPSARLSTEVPVRPKQRCTRAHHIKAIALHGCPLRAELSK